VEDTLIVIPTRRPPPIKTLESYPTTERVIVLADPRVHTEHVNYYYGNKTVQVVLGKVGSIPQALEVYRVAHQFGFPYFFRLDDDLQPKFFVDIFGCYPDLEEVMTAARTCITETRTSLAGFANTSRRDWLGEYLDYKRGAGLIHGGAQIGMSTDEPEQFLDPELPAYDDVYRSAAHRVRDGAVGVVAWIGLDKRESLRDTTVPKSPELIQKCKDIILGKFPGIVTCTGERVLDGGRQVIPNWRLVGRATKLL
jgi:hypothetical protein